MTSAAHVVPGVVEVVALLSCIQWGFFCSSAVRVIIDQVAAAVEDKHGPANTINAHGARYLA